MTSGEIIVLLLLAIGLACSLTLFVWLLRLLRRDRRAGDKPGSVGKTDR